MVQSFVELEKAIRITMSILDTNSTPITPETWKMVNQIFFNFKTL